MPTRRRKQRDYLDDLSGEELLRLIRQKCGDGLEFLTRDHIEMRASGIRLNVWRQSTMDFPPPMPPR